MLITVKCANCGFVQTFDDLDIYKCDDCGNDQFHPIDEDDVAAH